MSSEVKIAVVPIRADSSSALTAVSASVVAASPSFDPRVSGDGVINAMAISRLSDATTIKSKRVNEFIFIPFDLIISIRIYGNRNITRFREEHS
jgi:hypothetical protein